MLLVVDISNICTFFFSLVCANALCVSHNESVTNGNAFDDVTFTRKWQV
uniref:Uncharacterized protein n=1 Tax=Anguilla anguilla TaxID=7936 RepID=A0A0E9PP30_ANGAN